MALVVDTSVLLAALDDNDPDHDRSAALLDQSTEPLVIPVPVLTELDHMLGRRGRLDVWCAFAEDLASEAYDLHPASEELVLEASQMQQRYADLAIGFVDAAVFLACVALGEPKVATLDRRHFAVMRTPDGQALEIVPD